MGSGFTPADRKPQVVGFVGDAVADTVDDFREKGAALKTVRAAVFEGPFGLDLR